MGNKPLNGDELAPSTGISNPFYQPDLQAGQVGQVLNEFTFKSFYRDPYFEQCKVLQHRRSHQLIILKELLYSSEEEMEAAYAEFEKRRQRLTGDNIIRLRYLMKKHTQGLLRDQWKILLLFDYILIDMHTEARNRLRLNTKFTNEELSTILAGAVKGYASVEREGIPNDKVRLKNIYFGLKDQVPIVKIADSNLFPSKSNFLTVAENGRDQQDVFLSPEEMRTLATGQGPIANPKSGVYSLGMAMLELCLQNESREVYNYGARTMDLREVDERLNIVRTRFPLGYFYVLKEMLQKSVEHRVSFQQLESKLPSNLKNYSPNMTLSVIPRSQTNSAYVKDTVIHHLYSSRSLVNSQMAASKPGVLNSNRLLTSNVLPAEQISTLTSQYRPISTFNLHEVNEMYTNGNTYKGQKNAQGERHGKGKYTYEDGSFYYGDWYRNKMFGSGTLYYSDKSVEYDGEWKDDMFEGRGVLYGKACDWIKYEGQFKGGRMEGYGTMLFNDGNSYTGTFKADRPHGRGRLTKKEGTTQIGQWEHGKLLGLE